MKVKKRSVILFTSLAALIMVYFTNCAGDLEMSSSLNTLCITTDCYSANNSKLALEVDKELFIGEYDFITVKSGTRATTVEAFTNAKNSGARVPFMHMCMVDVGGACNDGGYEDNIIEWELMNANGSCSLKSTWAEKNLYRIYQHDNVADIYTLSGKCENGYFNLKVLYPCAVQGVQLTSADINLLNSSFGYYWQGPRALKLKIIGFDEQGKAHQSTKSADANITFGIPDNPTSAERCPQ